MQVIHFTEGTTEAISHFDAQGIRWVPLVRGRSDADPTVSCFHLASGSRIAETPFLQDSVLLLVSGRLTLETEYAARIDLSAGMGAVLSAGESVRLESGEGAILLAVESPQLAATSRGLSTPARIADQYWPGERPRYPR